MQELDLLLLRYLERDLPRASARERDAFARFLDLPDPELVRYLLAGEPAADVDFHRIATRAREPRR